MQPWNNWYHCTAHTYGTWLRGDPRGWRSRHHREHVEGDYKNPPPKGKYDEILAQSKELMKRDPVKIDHDEICYFALKSMLDRLKQFTIPVAIGCFDGIHAHILAQCPQLNPKVVIGIAKQFATAELKARMQTHGEAVGFQLELKPGEGIWAKGSHPKPIENQRHFKSSFNYINDHEKLGAIVIVPEAPEFESYAQLTEEDFLRDFGLMD